ncbi:histidine phosphatase family protein [Azospirillum sp.]|uniref:histidine phosphatase family protein n=1 Tax=Azospirillum sp. TaxID=34012 RepID=UPI002D2D1784|nr:histidine phosphatase family protein [Azospirillum sp.]HYD70830.1 histidine phosphatase family protein [Azospirillum sp.]
MADLFLVRHGQASFLAEDYDQLSETGLKQAAALGKWLRGTGRAAGLVVRGRMRRHRETAETCLAAWQPADGEAVPMRIDAAFDEFDHMDVLCGRHPEFREEGRLARFLATQDDPRRTFQELFTQSVERWTAGRHDGDYRESWGAFQARCVAGLRRVMECTPPSGAAWVFTSGGPMAAACKHVLELSDAKAMELNALIPNTAVTTLRHGRGRVNLAGFNSVAHLDAAGDADLFTYR